MAVHQGRTYQEGIVRIGAPPEEASAQQSAATVGEGPDEWRLAALGRPDIHYFAVYEESRLVGYILLHDIDDQTGDALVGYALHDLADRGRGIGTAALGLLQQFVRETTALHRLIIITSRDNRASQQLAEKCGFHYLGPSREDPTNGMVFAWAVPR